jgi:rRNA maturation RNase YbeY
VVTEDEEEEEVEDAGVSLAMSKLFTVEERLPLLLIHGILHLLGHDHETDEDWQLMTTRENYVMEQFYRRYTPGSVLKSERSKLTGK